MSFRRSTLQLMVVVVMMMMMKNENRKKSYRSPKHYMFAWVKHRRENEGMWTFKKKGSYLKNSGDLWCQGLTVIFQQKNVSDHHSFSFLEHGRFYRNKVSARTR